MSPFKTSSVSESETPLAITTPWILIESIRLQKKVGSELSCSNSKNQKDDQKKKRPAIKQGSTQQTKPKKTHCTNKDVEGTSAPA